MYLPNIVFLLHVHIGLCSAFFFLPDAIDLKSHVKAPVGEIIGTMKIVSFDGRSYQVNQYLGIPYAEAPIGNLRFRKPIPKARFVTPLDATKKGSNCIAMGGNVDKTLPDGTLMYAEDCLILNVYVPSKLQSPFQKYAVMVWIHGGGYTTGTSNDYPGHTLTAVNDIIVVTINYRLGFLGFFSTLDADAPGNFGLWDQHLAIKWVHDNIQSFGGDPGRVTIFGESAGSSSVVHEMFYAGNQGLFQRVIAESGTAANSWGYADNATSYRVSMIFANQLGCSTVDHVTLVYCLRSKSTTDVFRVMNNYPHWSSNFTLVLAWEGPIVDNDFVAEDPMKMVMEHSDIGLTNGRQTFNEMDFMIGANSYDGLAYTDSWTGDAGSDLFTRNKFENRIVPDSLMMALRTVPSDLAVKATIFEYTDWSNPRDDKQRSRRIFEMCTDFALWVPTVATVNAHARATKGSTYLYKFSVKPTNHIMEVPAWIDGPEVATHADELMFVFGFSEGLFHNWEMAWNVTLQYPHTQQELISAKAVMTMWTNFAKTGDPNRPVNVNQYFPSPWLPYNAQTQTYLDITPTMTSQSVKQKVAPRAVQFWSELLPFMNSL